jgi:hypothetical protein
MMNTPRLLLAATLAASPPQLAAAQLVPEGIHSMADGPETICGVTGKSAQDFEREVKTSQAARYNNETDRYVTYEGPIPMTLWAFAKPDNFAYPLATCIRIYEEKGAVLAERKMRCDATREQCDRAFIEFDELDGRNRRQIQEDVRR